MKKERIVVICPGRGTYAEDSLGYLNKYRPRFNDFISAIDERRLALDQPTLSELDNAATFTPALHSRGEHASALIYACAYADFMALDLDKYEVVAVTANSMGWYIALACAGVLDMQAAFEVVNTMGSMMKENIIGGQIIYSLVDDEWHFEPGLVRLVEQAIADANACEGCEAYVSIHLGGYLVIGGNPPGIDHLMTALPRRQNYPLRLINHAAFHTPLLTSTSRRAFEVLSLNLFRKPALPLVDGRGHIWQDFATDLEDLYHYTFEHQVVRPYAFTRAVTVCIKEFNPDRLVLLGPGNVLGGSIGQILIENHWRGLSSKSDFAARQKADPFLVSLARTATPVKTDGKRDNAGLRPRTVLHEEGTTSAASVSRIGE